ncbi:KpsF/GutQ family sugar-phosphate isomerase [Acuticoccus sediminis]|uniref:KpsF/GutQ family sugar-phosphate isomerase n=1 Tax=Acuticoccus sediminis TaxID=2184697 RepID=A0A8B2NU28_9HYPH|nr:KpsF/GutQ family sugar-phosphate isomerase [Acuticoccus sediminis]RAI00984.1 KpsF/GutQ family sugar-phosphate isomerase [Acuticoccus sediminis]
MTVVELRGSPHEADVKASAERTIRTEISAMALLADAMAGPLGREVARAVDLMAGCEGRIVVTGMGKSGHIAAKAAATLASTGTPAQFVHPAEASHGDLGMITRADVILALSWSGETKEMASILSYAKRFRVSVIAITSNAKSTLGRAADVALALPIGAEACPLGLAPTSSAVAQLAMADALAVALLERRGFTPTDFHTFHPGGRLGARLQFVGDLMHTGQEVPLVKVGTPMSEAIIAMSAKGFGTVGVVDAEGSLTGIVTDGDLRRHLENDILRRPVESVMSKAPKTIEKDVLAGAALEAMNSAKISTLFVTDEGKLVGILHMHDLLRAGVV